MRIFFLRLVTGRRVNAKLLAELERTERIARTQAEIDHHLAIIYRCREVARAEYDRVFGAGAHRESHC